MSTMSRHNRDCDTAMAYGLSAGDQSSAAMDVMERHAADERPLTLTQARSSRPTTTPRHR